MTTAGIWLGPIIAALIAVIGIPAGIRFRSRRGRAIDRIAAELASRRAQGYEEQYPEWVEFFSGRRADADGIVNPPAGLTSGQHMARGRRSRNTTG